MRKSLYSISEALHVPNSVQVGGGWPKLRALDLSLILYAKSYRATSAYIGDFQNGFGV